MKKVYLVFALIILGELLFGLNWTRHDLLDDFGDKNGHYVYESDFLEGTYKNDSGKSGRIIWSFIISDEGHVYFDIHEDDTNSKKNISITSKGPNNVSTSDELDIQIKVGNEILQFYGTVQRDENFIFDRVVLYEIFTTYGAHYSSRKNILLSSTRINYDLRSFFLNNQQVRIVISGAKGSYSLGSLDTSGFDASWFYDSSLFDEGIYLMSLNKYGEAEETFNRLREEDFEVFEFYEVEDYIHACREARISEELKDYNHFFDSGNYEEALKSVERLMELDELYQEFSSEIFLLERVVKQAGNIYQIGDRGPAYGIIFYDCDADNSKGNPDGLISSECGWRYLEAAPSVAFIDEDGFPMVTLGLLYSSDSPKLAFGYNKNENGKNVFVNNSSKYSVSSCTSTVVGTGRRNTSLLVNAMSRSNGNSLGSSSRGGVVWATDNYKYTAAEVCDLLSYGFEGSEVVFDDWFLPSRDELKLLLSNLDCNLANNNLPYGKYWSSSEDSSDPDLIWTVECPYKSWYGDYWGQERYNSYFVRPIRAF